MEMDTCLKGKWDFREGAPVKSAPVSVSPLCFLWLPYGVFYALVCQSGSDSSLQSPKLDCIFPIKAVFSSTVYEILTIK